MLIQNISYLDVELKLLCINSSADAGCSEEKTLNCRQMVWALAFGPCQSIRVDVLHQNGHDNELLLATGLNNGAIQVWVVSTGKTEL